MEDGDFLSNILLHGEGVDSDGSEELHVLETQESTFVEEVQASRSSTKGGGKRSKNFNKDEDEVLCYGWLAVSKDPVHGANQSRTTFWRKVQAYYEEHNNSGVPRTESSIMHRFLGIQWSVNRFCSYYGAILRRNQSGYTSLDKVNEAKKMYERLDKGNKKFVYEHCWDILKGEDKWKAKMADLAEEEKLKTKNKEKPAKKPRKRDEEGIDNDKPIAVDAKETEPRKRSDGIKKVKANLKGGGGQACMEALDKMWSKKEAFDMVKEKAKEDRFMATLEIEKASLDIEKATLELEKKRVENEAKKAEADLIKEEKEIMLTDETSLNPTQIAWLKNLQKKIMAKYAEN